VHTVAVVQAIPSASELAAPAGVGVLWIAHALPLQRSARVKLADPARLDPTAVHALDAVHATAKRSPCRPDGEGAVWVAQVVPFQASITGTKPRQTAVHEDAEAQETLPPA
jgi:L-ascorbate metabolism protein UlaG (beta-lactamase superfamily)